MALDTFTTIWNKVLLRCPLAGPALAQDWVKNAFRRLAERRGWSWLLKQGQFTLTANYTTGTVTVVNGSTSVTGLGTVWTSSHVGCQFRIGVTAPIYTVSAVGGNTSLTLDVAWGGASAATQSYEIYTAFSSVPTDFHYLWCVWDPNYNWQLYKDVAQTELNLWDSQRANSGQAYLVSPRDYYTPTGSTVPLPRYEIWPHVKSVYCLPFLYVIRASDLDDSGAVLPRYIRGDLLMEMALAECSRWPGPSADKPNPYFNLRLAQMHDSRAEFMIMELERQDDEVHMQNLQYTRFTSLPYAPFPFGDANWIQRHAI